MTIEIVGQRSSGVSGGAAEPPAAGRPSSAGHATTRPDTHLPDRGAPRDGGGVERVLGGVGSVRVPAWRVNVRAVRPSARDRLTGPSSRIVTDREVFCGRI